MKNCDADIDLEKCLKTLIYQCTIKVRFGICGTSDEGSCWALTRIGGEMSLGCMSGLFGEVLLFSRHRSAFLYIGPEGHLWSFGHFQ